MALTISNDRANPAIREVDNAHDISALTRRVPGHRYNPHERN